MRETGLTARADAGMDRFARLVAEVVGVPVALVALVEPSRQILPGMVGLAQPWARTRQTPLTHSLCRHVVAEGEPLVLTDARRDPRSCSSLATGEMGVVGYAGMPLLDVDGEVLGSLCAIDTRPREWTARELGLLEDLAAACTAELRLRIVSRQREAARADEADARAAAAEAATRYRGALDRSRVMLRAADALANTTGLDQVRRQVRDLTRSDLRPVYVGLALAEGKTMRRLVDATGSAPMELAYETYGLEDAWPTAHAARENRTVFVRDVAQLEAEYSKDAVAAFHSLGLVSAVCVPLPGAVIPLGSLVLGWDRPHETDILEQALLATLAGYAARAVERAQFVDERIGVARRMQEALLTDLPDVPGLELAALYRPAASEELVGGDWYDAYHLPTAAEGGEESDSPATLALSIGDITGHDLTATTLMGQVRSMLRQADLDHPGRGPAQAVRAFEHANAGLDIGASGTLIHAHLRPHPESRGAWELTWANAGHPPPLLVHPDTGVHLLEEHGVLLFPGLAEAVRTAYRRPLPPGSLLLLYTDGLVERPGTDISEAIDAVGRFLGDHAGLPLRELLQTLADTIASPDASDDIAVLALRVPRPPAPRR
ncbi:SpoIIE family protein phosphatase [Streptomyces sp. 8L]|uniref:SpoIIE family protein phosphatase n=1 Tax=Streptomyces sp. 8L TaxID=2877242 RepID=UPI001CD2D09E|nr:SpoIIE family protein phosphatase [Streptomyces sp. 8L]MCA1221434.1 SpoIIE family protein phosphatase [Streptomyces sp. 8L]